MSLQSSFPRPLLAVSLIVPALVYIAYRWHTARNQEGEPEGDSSPQQVRDVGADRVLEFSEVQQRLQSIRRHRLDTLEEEAVEDNPASDIGQPRADTEDVLVKEIETLGKTRSAAVPVPVFASTDIRYRHRAVDTALVELVKEEEEVDMTGTETEMQSQDKVPDVLSALQDPLCLASPPSPHSYSSSPVKSEASSEGRQSTEWSDLIEQDERDSFQQVLSSKLSGLELDVARARSGDSGVVSPSEGSEGERERQLSESQTIGKTRLLSGEDAGIGGSEQGEVLSDFGQGTETNYEDSQLMSYQFHIPDYLCGKLIGINGTFIKKLKEDCLCNIVLKETEGIKPKKSSRNPRSKKDQRFSDGIVKVCSIEGTRANIDKCLDIVKLKFQPNREVSFDQVNICDGRSGGGGAVLALSGAGSVALSLAEGCMHEVFVSSIVGGGHVFLQQPYHPTFHALERLDQCMTKTYSQFQCPAIPSPVQVNTICVAPCQGGWYRCQVVSVDSSSQQCDIKFLDYGGYHTLSLDDLRQIRTDFLTLPFQAIECYLANISPIDDENVSAFVLEELIAKQIVQARMIGTNETGVPMIHLYRAVAGQTTMVNRELVDRRCAHWLDTTIVKLESQSDVASSAWVASGDFQSMSLLPNPSSQVNPIFHNPSEEGFEDPGVAGSSWQELYRPPSHNPSLGDFWLLA